MGGAAARGGFRPGHVRCVSADVWRAVEAFESWTLDEFLKTAAASANIDAHNSETAQRITAVELIGQ